jgi:hypothetical protein
MISYIFNYVKEGKKGKYQCSGEDFFKAVAKFEQETKGQVDVLASRKVIDKPLKKQL